MISIQINQVSVPNETDYLFSGLCYSIPSEKFRNSQGEGRKIMISQDIDLYIFVQNTNQFKT